MAVPLCWILQFLTVGHAKKVEPLHCAEFRLNRSNPDRRGDFLLFKMGAAAIFDVWNFRFLMIGTDKKVELCHRAKFRRNRLNCSRYVAIFQFFKDGGRRHLGFSKFQIFNGRKVQEGPTASLCQISSKSLKTRPRYVSWNIMLVWLENAYSRPFVGGFWGTFPPNDVTHRPNPKRTVLGLNHVIWAKTAKIGRSVRAGRMNEKKRTGQDRKKVTKGLYFTYLSRSPHWSDVHENLCSGLCSRRNHVCQVSKWNFQGLQFYRGSNFPFFLLILNGPYNSAALLRCLW